MQCNRGRAQNALAACFVLIAATILAARKLGTARRRKEGSSDVSAIDDAIRWAEQIMAEIDRRWPVNVEHGIKSTVPVKPPIEEPPPTAHKEVMRSYTRESRD